jgi:GTPase SAR1 family protein
VKLQQYKGFATPQLEAKVIDAKFSIRIPTKATCYCGTITRKRICPECHNVFPHRYLEMKNLIIALIGAKKVGKSHYIAVLIHELKNRVGSKLNTSLSAQDEQTIKRYTNDFERFLYVQKETIPVTPSARARIEGKYPLVYQLKLPKKRLFLKSSYTAINLVFFDTAGEDLGNIDTISTEAKYIANADGLIFLLDPCQLPNIQEQINISTLINVSDDQQVIIERATKLIQRNNNLPKNYKIKIPIAISFTKLDFLEKIIDPLLRRASNHDGYFDKDDFHLVNAIFNSYVEKWFGTNPIIFLDQHYKDFAFLGLSAIGSNPDKTGRINKGVNPFRVEDPLLWILYKKGILKAK